MPVEGPDSRKEFYLEIKNPPTSENTTVDNLFRWLFYGKKVEVKRRPRTFAPARFSLTMTLNFAMETKAKKLNYFSSYFGPVHAYLIKQWKFNFLLRFDFKMSWIGVTSGQCSFFGLDHTRGGLVRKRNRLNTNVRGSGKLNETWKGIFYLVN